MKGWSSWPCCLTYSGQFTHINGYPSAAGPVQTSEIRRSETDVLPLSGIASSSDTVNKVCQLILMRFNK